MLSVSLTEPVVFLRRSSDLTASGRRRQVTTEAPPAVLRGVLTLKLSKPAKIKTVEVFVTGTLITEWPEGIGPRRVEVTEEQNILSTSATLFKAGEHPLNEGAYRRAKSLGPGVTAGFESDAESDDEEGTRGRTRYLGPRRPHGSRSRSSRSPDRDFAVRNRGMSMDPLGRSTYPFDQPMYNIPSPAYTPEPTVPELPEAEYETASTHGQRTLEEIRDALRDSDDPSLRDYASTSNNYPSYIGIRSAASSRPPTSTSRSRPPSIHHSSYYINMESQTPNLSPTTTRQADGRLNGLNEDRSADASPAMTPMSSPDASANRRFSFTRTGGRPSSRHASANLGLGQTSPVQTPDGSNSTVDELCDLPHAGKHKHKRFSLGMAWHDMKELVLPHSRRASSNTERPISPRGPSAPSRPGSILDAGSTRRQEGSRGRDRSVVGKLSAINFDDHPKEVDWQEFRKGTYNWPISFTIPPECPPSIRCEYGYIVYRVRAQVTRTGTFSSNLSASTEFTVIACPGEDDMEESESIIIEREWDSNLRYLITLSGKSFPIGGTIPLNLVLMPLGKMAVYRFSVLLEEKIDYYAHGGKVGRHEPTRRWELISIKNPEKHAPLLPNLSEKSDAISRSPLAPFIDEEDPSEATGQLLNPTGPWRLKFALKVPDCATQIHFTNKYTKARIVVSHAIKIVIRVDRGDAADVDAKGKKKQYDIIIESPIQLLSCRCNPEWMSLPTYSLFPVDDSRNSYACICQSNRVRHGYPAVMEPHHVLGLELPPPLFGGSAMPSLRPYNDTHLPSQEHRDSSTIAANSRQYALLVSGAEREDGERPPTYEAATHS